MDRVGAGRRASAGRDRRDPSANFLLPSRASALSLLQKAIEAGEGPVLLTGDAGSGKTWLGERLRSQSPASWRWAAVDLTPSLRPAGLYRLIAREMGLDLGEADDTAAARVLLADALAEAACDAEPWCLLVDEAEAGGDDVLEEIRVLSNRIGREDGFSAVLLVGQSRLHARLARRPLSVLGARMRERVHLRPLAQEDLRVCLGQYGPIRDRELFTAERVHRAVQGNPRLAFRLLATLLPHTPAVESRPASAEVTPASQFSAPPVQPKVSAPAPPPPLDETRVDLRPVLSVRPPIEVSDEIVEVGWDPAPELESTAETTTEALAVAEAQAIDRFEELSLAPPEPELEPEQELAQAEPTGPTVVEDRYAALQAWRELSQLPGRPFVGSAVEDPGESLRDLSGLEADAEPADPDTETTETAEGLGFSPVRLEEQHGFAPYSQLFSKLRQTRDTP